MTEKTYLSDVRFADMELAPDLMKGIEEAGFVQCTPIQAQTLPLALAGQDIAGQAQTGTGKTAAFLLALMHRLLQHATFQQAHQSKQPRGLILAPTRELAIQIYQDALVLGRYTGLSIAVVYGGIGYKRQREELIAGVDILIATPGRLIDYFKQGVFHLKALQCVVIDEADRMFDLGFIKDLRFLLRRMPSPEKRLNLLFSATFSHRVHELAYEHLNAPILVQVDTGMVVADKVEERLYHVSTEEKMALLLGLLRQIKPLNTDTITETDDNSNDVTHQQGEKVLIFINTKKTAEAIWQMLCANDYYAALLSGDVPQKKRMQLLAQFQSGHISVLVATDVAARGLHIPTVGYVINYDFPQDSEDYVHRIGRTARAGESGHAISLICEQYVYSLDDVEQYIGHKIESYPITEQLLITPRIAVKEKSRKKPAFNAKPRKPHKPHKTISVTVEPANNAEAAAEPTTKKRRRRPKKKDTEKTPIASSE